MPRSGAQIFDLIGDPVQCFNMIEYTTALNKLANGAKVSCDSPDALIKAWRVADIGQCRDGSAMTGWSFGPDHFCVEHLLRAGWCLAVTDEGINTSVPFDCTEPAPSDVLNGPSTARSAILAIVDTESQCGSDAFEWVEYNNRVLCLGADFP